MAQEELRSKYTIRTSDRRVFRRCLRKWEFQSSMKGNWKHVGTEQNINFWFGSAIHFAMEDFFGYNRFKDPRRAFYAYYKAFPEDELPLGAAYHYELGMAMLSYFLTWYEKHNEVAGFETLWLAPDADGILRQAEPYSPGSEPAVEQKFYIPLNVWAATDVLTDDILEVYYDVNNLPTQDESMDVIVQGRKCHIVPIMYHGTMDRLVVDRYGRWWILDYKTAKGADTNKLDTDDQISAYLWAAEQWFHHDIYGFIYLQLTKDVVQEPKRLKNGKLSVDKRQKTTYNLVKQEIIKDYGKVNAAPDDIIQFLNHLAEQEAPEGDRFIRWDFVKRNRNQIESTYRHILGELQLMLNPNLYCFPSPTRDCIWDCPIRAICIAMDSGDQELIDKEMLNFEKRPRDEDGNIEEWRENLQYPETDADLIPIDDILLVDQCMNIQLNGSTAEADAGFHFMYEEDR